MLKKIFSKILNKKDPQEIEYFINNFKRFINDMIKPNYKILIISIVFMIIFGLSNAALAWLIKPIINQVFVLQDINYLYLVAAAIIFVSFTKGLAQYIYTLLLFKVSTYVILKARQTIYSVFIRQDIAFFNKNSSGHLTSAMLNEINSINNLATQVPVNLGRDLFSFLGLFILMVYLQPIYSALILLSIVVIILPIQLINKKLKIYFKRGVSEISDLTNHIQESLASIKEVKSYSAENREITRTNQITSNVAKISMKSQRVGTILSPFMEFLGGASIAVVMVFAGTQVAKGNTDPGTFFSFVAALLLAYQPLKRLSSLYLTIQVGILSIARYYSFLNCTPQIVDTKNPVEINPEKIKLQFQNVSFKYIPDENDISVNNMGNEYKNKTTFNQDEIENTLTNINFEINHGETVALVGKSGGGKSTIISLIPRFYDVTEGQILINDTNIKDIKISSLRGLIASVSQDVVLFNDTIYNNIAYSNPDASYEQVINAATQSASIEFINEFPNKFETIVGPKGVRLSGGQKQRISIARALLKDAPIMLLDEATSALDTESEKLIQKTIDDLTEKKTSIIIAHRLSTILKADKIIVIDRGKIVEQGTHLELLEQKGYYYNLYNLQFKE